MTDVQLLLGELTRACHKDKKLFLLEQVDSGISAATMTDYTTMYENLYPTIASSIGTSSTTRREVDTPVNMFSEKVMEHARKMPLVLSLLARRFATTDGDEGIRLKPRQIPLIRLMMAGLTKARLGDINLARYKHEIKQLFHPTKITDRVFDKAGRRKGKTFVVCVFIAIAMLTQPQCDGISVAFDSTNTLVNRECVQAVMESIINDPLQKMSDYKIVTYSKSSNLYIKVVFPDGRKENKCRFTPSPEATNFRGSGKVGGFFHVDEADFISAKAFGKFQPIWSMQIFIIMTSSQGYALSKATEMALTAVLANGELVWYIVYSQADKVTQVVSDDYVRDQTEDSSMKYVVSGAMPTDSDRTAALTKSITQNHKKRPWYDPICTTLEQNRVEFLRKMQIKERQAESDKLKRDQMFTSSTQPLDPEIKRVGMRGISRDKLHEYIRSKNPVSSLVGRPSNHNRENREQFETDLSLVVKEHLTFEECIFLLTLPDQQSPAQMLRVKAEMGPEAFTREMLNKMPEASQMMHATFNREELEFIFNRENFIDDFDSLAHRYLHWLIAYDPGKNGRLSDALFASILLQSPPADDPNEIACLFDSLDSESLRQRMVLTGGDILEGVDALDIDETAKRIVAHIIKLCEEYPSQKRLVFYIAPEANDPYVAYNLPIKVASQLAHLKNDPRLKIYVPEIKTVYTAESLQRPTPMAGVLTTNATKTTAIMRLCARFNRGTRSFAISKRFVTTSPRPGGLPGEPPVYWEPQEMLALFFDHLTALQTIPPALNSRSQVTTYNGKVIFKKDDGAHVLMIAEGGNAIIISLRRQNPLFSGQY